MGQREIDDGAGEEYGGLRVERSYQVGESLKWWQGVVAGSPVAAGYAKY